MAKKLHITFTGESEKFMTELNRLGLSDTEIIAQSLSVLKTVHETKRVALLKPRLQGHNIEVDYYLTVVETDEGITDKGKAAEETLNDKVAEGATIEETVRQPKKQELEEKSKYLTYTWPRPELPRPEQRLQNLVETQIQVIEREQQQLEDELQQLEHHQRQLAELHERLKQQKTHTEEE